jgi:hypothetical protein
MSVTEVFVLLTATPSPKPFDENTATPGWVGFAITFGIGAITILLIIDMTRRVRRARYRGEIREKLEGEREQAEIERDEADRKG